MTLTKPVQAASKQRVHEYILLPNRFFSLGMHQVLISLLSCLSRVQIGAIMIPSIKLDFV